MIPFTPVTSASIPRPAQRRRIALPVLAGILAALASGCRPQAPEESSANREELSLKAPEIPVAATKMVSAAEMRKRLGADEQARFERSGLNFVGASLVRSGAVTLAPLQGEPLRQLDISMTSIDDLSPLHGMPLERLMLLQTPVTDLSPLQGMPLVVLDASETPVSDISVVATLPRLRELYLEKARVADITPLKEIPLQKLWLSHCPVADLRPLSGHQFVELNLCNTQVRDLKPLREMPIGTLWLRETPIENLDDLQGLQLVSLDIQGTAISDLTPLQNMTSLQRLNISGTAVTDLTPLAGLQLSRLIFSPQQIQRGLEVVRSMPSLRELDISFDGTTRAATPSEFWERFDRSNSKAETPN